MYSLMKMCWLFCQTFRKITTNIKYSTISVGCFGVPSYKLKNIVYKHCLSNRTVDLFENVSHANMSVMNSGVVVFSDPRTKNWFLLNNNPFPVWILTALYITMVFVGPRIMEHRQPFNLKTFMLVYNLSLVGLSIYMFIEVSPFTCL